MGLFDGHGKFGKNVVEYCVEFMTNFFNNSSFLEDPARMVHEMMIQCDESLREESNIDVKNSGAAAVVLFVSDKGIVVGNVGDSRGVLATSIPQERDHEPDISNPYVRTFECARQLYPVQLTTDHKPNHEGEIERIVSAGGIVQKISNEMGERVGPFRVWVRGKNKPGLAMSRALGDGLAKTVGVVANPTIHEFPFCYTADQFIVIGSDGLWDVFPNSHAVNFVEKFRKKCLQELNASATYPVKPRNSTVAHLLAEEARYRWLGICEDEDVPIDDISVVVLEIVNPPPTGDFNRLAGARRIERLVSFEDVPHNESTEYAVDKRVDVDRKSQVISKPDRQETAVSNEEII